MNRSDRNDWSREAQAQDEGWKLGYAKGRQDRLREWAAFFAGAFVGGKITLPALIFLTLVLGALGGILVLLVLHFFWWFFFAGVLLIPWSYRRHLAALWRQLRGQPPKF